MKASVLLLLVALISGCAYPFNQCSIDSAQCLQFKGSTHEIRQRAASFALDEIGYDYCEEYAYIRERRSQPSDRTTKPQTPACGKDKLNQQLYDDKHKIQPPTPPEHLVGLALSGGGLRSATFNLGVLQAINSIKTNQGHPLLSQIDYLSTVSGGSYIAGWMLAHLAAEKPDRDDVDKAGYSVGTTQLGRLLDDKEDFIGHLRANANFINEGGFWEGFKLIGSYLWRMPANALWSLGLHNKSFPEIDNGVHMIVPYRARIERTYLRGRETLPLAQLNAKNLIAPYLILNGNLVNSGRAMGGHGEQKQARWKENYNFEFTRDFTGSDGIGYVKTQGFGLPVLDVVNIKIPIKQPGVPWDKVSWEEFKAVEEIAMEKRTPGWVTVKEPVEVAIQYQEGAETKEVRVKVNEPRTMTTIDEKGNKVAFTVTVNDRCDPSPTVQVHTPVGAKITVAVEELGPSCVRLADAMATSGAAIDLKSTLVEVIRGNEILRISIEKLLALFNLDFNYHAYNFAERKDDIVGKTLDYGRMITTQRILWPNTQDLWLEITDGSFFDNLGVYSLLRRSVRHIIVADATWDPGWTYKYLHHLHERVKELGESVKWCNNPALPGEGEIVWYRQFWVKLPSHGQGDSFAVIHYLKPYAYNPFLFTDNPNLKPSGKPFMSSHPAMGPLAQSWEGNPERPIHFDEERINQLPDEKNREVMLKAAKRVTAFAHSTWDKDFPQTSTFFQWFGWEQFEAYRLLGYAMGQTYLSQLEFNDAALKPPAGCS